MAKNKIMELEVERTIKIQLPVQDIYFPRTGLTHEGKLRFPYSEILFDYFSKIWKERQEISIKNHAVDYESWLGFRISKMVVDKNWIVLDLDEYY